MSALWVCVYSPLRRGGRQVTSENVQGSHGRVLMARAPSGEGGRLAAKPQMGRGLGTAETNLVAALSWQGFHGPGGGKFKQLSHSSIV